MNNRTYIIPGLKNWTFKTSDTGYGLWSGLGNPGVVVTADMPSIVIAARVQEILWLTFNMSGAAAEVASKAALKVDWQAMIQEAGTDVQHQTPGLPGWTLKISDLGSGLWYSSGAVVQLTADTPRSEIADGVQRILQSSLPSVEIDVQVDEVMRIDFKKLITNAWAPKVAPLLDGCVADNSSLVNEICADVKLLALLQKGDNTALVEMILALVNELAA